MSVALYTLDVGHGLCQAVMFPGRRCVLIDCGDVFAVPIVSEFLERFVDVLLAFVATHNDQDHVGGVLDLLEMPKYGTREKLHKIWCLADRGSNCEIPLLDYALRREEKGTIGEFRYGCLNDEDPLRPRLIHEEPNEASRLELLYPRMSHNIPSFRTKTKSATKQNRTSACIRLTVGSSRALITGDIDLIGLTTIAEKYGFDLRADLLTIPHHGGHIPGNSKAKTWMDIVNLIVPTVALVSCGYRSRTTTSLLQRETFSRVVKVGAGICCTQITQACHPYYKKYYPGVNLRLRGKVPQMAGNPGFPEAVGCCGSMLTVFSKNRLKLSHSPEQGHVVGDPVSASGTPLCM